MQATNQRGETGIGTLVVLVGLVMAAPIAADTMIETATDLADRATETSQQRVEQLTNRLQVIQATGVKTGRDPHRRLGGVELLVMRGPGAGRIDLRGVTIQWIDSTGTYHLVHEDAFGYGAGGAATADGAFAHTAIRDADGSLSGTDSAALSTVEDRAVITIDVGRSDVLADNDIGAAYDNHTYDSRRPAAGVTEATVRERLSDPALGNPDGETTPIVDGGAPTPYVAGTVLRSGAALEPGETVSLRLTTPAGATSTVQLVVPESLHGTTAVRL